MNEVILCIGPGGAQIGEELIQKTGFTNADVSRRVFPDSEICMRINTSLVNKTVVVFQNTLPPQDLHLQQLYQMVEISKSRGAAYIICVVPYLAYSRQDRRSNEGEPESGLVVLRTLAMLGANEVVTIDIHSEKLVEKSPIPLISLSTEIVFAEYFKTLNLNKPIIISPDSGGAQRVKAVSAHTKYPILVLDKHKNEEGYTWYNKNKLDINGYDAIVLDDLCSSGSTFIPLARYLNEMNAQSIYYGVTHFFADGNYIKQEIGSPVHLIGSNSIPSQWTKISVTDLIVKWLEMKFIIPKINMR
ncbi:hypothetical protein EL84_00250 [Paenibacillus sp. VT-400]|uniref:ribose-phosphate diphosphokinase n=1 Tax=Paenibacillus sp. VT-400 TaxID=1495853 RepID=UPI000649ACFD|nr:ribose-phosphate diphosphokinase [Paenibacillus sp. VT-400]KLU58237.1 hypothetical protein EL84_00250 [Paenibacillus sp. VT-400]